MKKKMIVLFAIISIAVIGVTIYFINQSMHLTDEDIKERTISPYAEEFVGLVCVKNMDGTFEYLAEDGETILQIEADDVSNICVTEREPSIWSKEKWKKIYFIYSRERKR